MGKDSQVCTGIWEGGDKQLDVGKKIKAEKL